jgi:hypothetical protein
MQTFERIDRSTAVSENPNSSRRCNRLGASKLEPSFFRGKAPALWFLMCCAAFMAVSALTGYFILLSWRHIEKLRSSNEVDRYILDHREWISTRRLDPSVHELTLSNRDGVLNIVVDVEDKRTFDKIEDELADIYSLRFPPKWATMVRSQEELGNNWGYAAWGVGELAIAVSRLCLAFGGSVVFWGIVAFLVWWRSSHWKKQTAVRVSVPSR